jgi:hypothetical protein
MQLMDVPGCRVRNWSVLSIVNLGPVVTEWKTAQVLWKSSSGRNDNSAIQNAQGNEDNIYVRIVGTIKRR